MNICPKCGSYIPEGKILCPACGRLNIGVTSSAGESTHHEHKRTMQRIHEAQLLEKRDAWSMPEKSNPGQGCTYEKQRSHGRQNTQYRKPEFNPAQQELPEPSQRIICAMAYFGVLFFLPLVLLPNSKQGRFHANQGLLLFLLNICMGVASAIFGTGFLSVVSVWLMFYGAANAFRGNMVELPIVGKIRLIGEDVDSYGGRR